METVEEKSILELAKGDVENLVYQTQDGKYYTILITVLEEQVHDSIMIQFTNVSNEVLLK